MDDRIASCGTIPPKVEGQAANRLDSASYARLRSLMGDRMPDPAILARVVVLLQEMERVGEAIRHGRAMVEVGLAAMRAEGDRRLAPIIVEMEELRQGLRELVDADATGAIHAALLRIMKREE